MESSVGLLIVMMDLYCALFIVLTRVGYLKIRGIRDVECLSNVYIYLKV